VTGGKYLRQCEPINQSRSIALFNVNVQYEIMCTGTQ
jgi:hypothetical protein